MKNKEVVQFLMHAFMSKDDNGNMKVRTKRWTAEKSITDINGHVRIVTHIFYSDDKPKLKVTDGYINLRENGYWCHKTNQPLGTDDAAYEVIDNRTAPGS
jgi:hypothetical protein